MSNYVYELRQYRTFPGKRDEFVRLMNDEVIPFQRECGVDVVGTFVSADDPELYVWIRRFEDLEARDRVSEAIYTNSRWKEDFDGPIRDMIDYSRVRVTTLNDASSLLGV